ncbi:hypothetical protein [Acidobacterium sp. S8]|uniref:hypothetical protein n=1 Tax=Acidobacterium sp. S8 TaxID=1641854 RepID=UPI00131A767A|nr:hypothetical protein [Acidobacterium sp. S8]
MSESQALLDQIFDVSESVRYAALYRDDHLVSRQRDEIAGASSNESDRYEELFVNPTLLTLIRQRGNVDCGGAQFVVVRYGNFYQLVIALTGGHVSVCFELSANPLEYAGRIRDICE